MKKKSFLLLTLLCLSCLLLAATCQAEEVIPARYAPILESCNATNIEELYLNLLVYLNEANPEENGWYTPKHRPLSIRFGGTTKDLIADKKNWDLAIVSSREVDLQTLADEGLIMRGTHIPDNKTELRQWLAPEKLQALLPYDPVWTFCVFFYDYNIEFDDTTLLICQDNIGKKKNHPRTPHDFAEEILRKRTSQDVRTMEGICRVENWSEEELLTHPEDWDVATLIIDENDRLEALDKAGLLFDFSHNAYFTSRDSTRPYGTSSYHLLPNGIFSADGRMIGVPCVELGPGANDAGKIGVLLLNAQSKYLERAVDYATHLMKSKDWDWTAEAQKFPPTGAMGIFIYKDQVDW